MLVFLILSNNTPFILVFQNIFFISPENSGLAHGKLFCVYKDFSYIFIYYKQGIKVRTLKEAKVEKSELQPEIDLLLQLKSKLSIAKGLPADDGKKKKEKQRKN